MPTEYDDVILSGMADQLYREARWLELRYGLLGALAGLVGGALATSAADAPWFFGAGFGAILGAMVGYSLAKQAAFLLRVRAQTILCQVQIERNTRR